MSTSHMTSAPFLRVESGKTATGLSRAVAELRPSACWVELPSKFHIGNSSSLGKPSNST